VVRCGRWKKHTFDVDPYTGFWRRFGIGFIRGVETFLNEMAATSLEALRRGQAAFGAKNSNQVVILDQVLDMESYDLLHINSNNKSYYK